MTKMLEIQKCRQCFRQYLDVGQGYRCVLTGDIVSINKKIPDNCPLPSKEEYIKQNKGGRGDEPILEGR